MLSHLPSFLVLAFPTTILSLLHSSLPLAIPQTELLMLSLLPSSLALADPVTGLSLLPSSLPRRGYFTMG
jgi:hypothetical protein